MKSAGDDFASPSSGSDTNASGADTATSGDEGSPGARQTISENVTKLKGEAADRVLGLADQGKARASGALDQLSQMLNDAAAQVDDKLGAQYGQYARNAAESVQGFSSSLNDRSVDDLLDDARALVRKSPAVAIGAAAAAGFVVARLLSAGLDQRDKG
ncbi:hypothetical protein F1C10_02425 [Sphingomonas sp. NBWT7]|nr:hypothetical protein F1C10_02425 [Sphingomonas sp. NBWT7]